MKILHSQNNRWLAVCYLLWSCARVLTPADKGAVGGPCKLLSRFGLLSFYLEIYGHCYFIVSWPRLSPCVLVPLLRLSPTSAQPLILVMVYFSLLWFVFPQCSATWHRFRNLTVCYPSSTPSCSYVHTLYLTVWLPLARAARNLGRWIVRMQMRGGDIRKEVERSGAKWGGMKQRSAFPRQLFVF